MFAQSEEHSVLNHRHLSSQQILPAKGPPFVCVKLDSSCCMLLDGSFALGTYAEGGGGKLNQNWKDLLKGGVSRFSRIQTSN